MILKKQLIRSSTTPDSNGRTYTSEVILSMAKDINMKKMFGELGRPDNGVISLNNVSHQILNARVKNDRLPRKRKKLLKKFKKYQAWYDNRKSSVFASIKVLDTPMGKVLSQKLEKSKKLAVWTRGVGEVYNGIVSNYRMITADIIL